MTESVHQLQNSENVQFEKLLYLTNNDFTGNEEELNAIGLIIEEEKRKLETVQNPISEANKESILQKVAGPFTKLKNMFIPESSAGQDTIKLTPPVIPPDNSVTEVQPGIHTGPNTYTIKDSSGDIIKNGSWNTSEDI